MSAIVDKNTFKIGIIGFGDMGRLYARCFSENGYQTSVCDLPELYESLLNDDLVLELGLKVHKDGVEISKTCDFVVYSVEAVNIVKVIQMFAKFTKKGAVVGGQTAVKVMEVEAFEKHLPSGVDIITFHSMHGPKISPQNQPLIVVSHKDNNNSYLKVKQVFENCLKSKIVKLDSAVEHDRLCAVTQAATHVAFLSMGTAWLNRDSFPWIEEPYSKGGIENVKVNITLRIFSQKWHVYNDLAMLNKMAKPIVNQYSKSVNQIFELIITHNKKELENRMFKAKQKVFEKRREEKPVFEKDTVLDRFTLRTDYKKPQKFVMNSHLSLLAVVDCWDKMNINPYEHKLYETPPFRMYFGIVEYLFLHEDMLEKTINAAINTPEIRGDDLAFCSSVVGWNECIKFENSNAFKDRFTETKRFFESKLKDALDLSNKMINATTINTKE